MVGNCRSVLVGVLLVAFACQADPAVTCRSDQIGGLDRDVCVGNPGQVVDTGPEGQFHTDPELRIGVGIWPGF